MSNKNKVKKWAEQEQGKHFCKCGCGEAIVIKSKYHWGGIPDYIKGHKTNKWIAENQGKHFCKCGCGQPVPISRSKHIYKFIKGHRDVPVKKWIAENQGKHFCKCGCGKVITITPYHHFDGIPNFLPHHWNGNPEAKKLVIELRQKHRMDTKEISQKLKELNIPKENMNYWLQKHKLTNEEISQKEQEKRKQVFMQRDYLTEMEIKKFLSIIQNPRDKAVFWLAYHYGLNALELASLKESDIDFSINTITINRFNKNSLKEIYRRKYVLNDEGKQILLKWFLEKPVSDCLFCIKNVNSFKIIFKKYGKLAFLPQNKQNFPVLLNSRKLHLFNQGISLSEIAHLTGYKNASSLASSRFSIDHIIPSDEKILNILKHRKMGITEKELGDIISRRPIVAHNHLERLQRGNKVDKIIIDRKLVIWGTLEQIKELEPIYRKQYIELLQKREGYKREEFKTKDKNLVRLVAEQDMIYPNLDRPKFTLIK